MYFNNALRKLPVLACGLVTLLLLPLTLPAQQPAPAGAPGPGGPVGGMGGAPREAPASYVAPTDPRILSGIWVNRQRQTNTAPVIKAAYLAQIPQGTQAPGQAPLYNKNSATLCIPDGYFGTGGGYPNVIVQTANQVTLMNEENHRVRRIYLDGRKPKLIVPSYAGFSLGQWQGDTLMVKTTDFKQRVESVTLPPGFYITEQFRRINNGRVMEYTVNFNSDAYEKPGVLVMTWNWRPDVHIQEQICEENSDNFDTDYKF